MKKNDSIADLVWRNIAVYLLETNLGGTHMSGTILLRGNSNFFQILESIMSVSTAYDYTCRFCAAVNSVLISLDVALRATSAAANGDHEKAKDIMLAQ
jgi:hypothetical protein